MKIIITEEMRFRERVVKYAIYNPYFLLISSLDINSSVPPRASPQATPKSPPSMRSYVSMKYTF